MNKDYVIWIDVEDIFQYFENNARPSGIQRVVFEILHVIRQQAAQKPGIGRIVLTRRGKEEACLLSSVTFEELEALFSGPWGEKITPPRAPAAKKNRPTARA
ncbi:MAG: glycosyltransferase family 1 protein, partial [Gluconobacter cerinus]